MTSSKGVLLSLPVVTVALGALAIALIELGRYWGLGLDSLFLLAVPIALALIYLAWYRTLPYAPRAAPAGTGPASLAGAADSEPFEDPVEEADELDRAGGGPPPEEPAVVDDDAPSDSPPSP
jgi:hypothetical protein